MRFKIRLRFKFKSCLEKSHTSVPFELTSEKSSRTVNHVFRSKFSIRWCKSGQFSLDEGTEKNKTSEVRSILFDRAIKHMLSHITPYYLQPAPLIGGQPWSFNCSDRLWKLGDFQSSCQSSLKALTTKLVSAWSKVPPWINMKGLCWNISDVFSDSAGNLLVGAVFLRLQWEVSGCVLHWRDRKYC